MKECVDLALRRIILVDVDPETMRKQQKKAIAYRRARQIRAKGWSAAIGNLVIDGKIKIDITRTKL
jgi:hypothetical protein